jgi:hypothetical protein
VVAWPITGARTMTHVDRIAEISRQIAELDAQRAPLAAERARLITEQARRDWPAGPFTLHYWRYHSQYDQEFDTPLEALASARSIEDSGDGSTEKITDRHGTVIYDLTGYPPVRVVDSYPEVPDDL